MVNALSKGGVQAGNLILIAGVKSMAVLYLPSDVTDTETVTIGNDVYEFDRAADGVVAGRIAVGTHADDTPANATDALIAAINGSGTMPVTAYDGGDNEVIVAGNWPSLALPLEHTLAGVGNTWSTATLSGGANPSPGKMATSYRVPSATEVTLGQMRFLYDFVPLTAIARVHVTATGVEKLWDGSLNIDAVNQMITVTNGGAVDFDADDTVSVIAVG